MAKISVLSPAYNHDKYISEAIRSVLSQTVTDFEYKISDDASTDDTVAQIKTFDDPRIVLLTNDQNAGTSINSKRCFLQSSGEYVAWLTTDDIYETNALGLLSSYLDSHPNVVGVFGRSRMIDESGAFTGEEWKDDGVGMDRFQLLRSIFYCEHVFCPPAAMARRKALERVHYLSPNIRQINDMDLWIRLLFTGDLVILPDLIFRFRTRNDQKNISAPTEENVIRFTFEMSEILELFSLHVTTFDTLVKIFPEVLKEDWPAEDRFVPFYIARLALQFEHPSHQLYALRLLYRVFSSESLARELKEKLDFGYPEYFALTGSIRIFYDFELRAQRDNLEIELEEKIARLGETSRQLAALTGRYEDLKQTCNRYISEIQLLQSTLQERDEQKNETTAVINTLMERCRELEQTCHNYVSSSSWRLTAPIRQLKQSVIDIVGR